MINNSEYGAQPPGDGHSCMLGALLPDSSGLRAPQEICLPHVNLPERLRSCPPLGIKTLSHFSGQRISREADPRIGEQRLRDGDQSGVRVRWKYQTHGSGAWPWAMIPARLPSLHPPPGSLALSRLT